MCALLNNDSEITRNDSTKGLQSLLCYFWYLVQHLRYTAISSVQIITSRSPAKKKINVVAWLLLAQINVDVHFNLAIEKIVKETFQDCQGCYASGLLQ